MAVISRNTFDPTRFIRRILYQAGKVIVDFEENELQDNILDLLDRLASGMTGGDGQIGEGGIITPPVSATARYVDVSAGVGQDGATMVRIPDTTDLRVFNDPTVSGQHETLVYVKWRDVEATDVEFPDIEDATFGETALREVREAIVEANIGLATVPTIGGWNTFGIGLVTHDFDTDGTTILDKDVNQSGYSPITPGELGGLGPQRPLRLRVNNFEDQDVVILSFLTALTTGRALVLEDEAGNALLQLDKNGKLTLAAGVALGGDLTTSGLIDTVDLAAFKAAYDAHDHDDRYYTDAEVNALIAPLSVDGHNHDGDYLPVGGGTATGVIKHDGNYKTQVVGQGITTPVFVELDAMCKRGLVARFKVDPGAYGGTYDIKVYSNDTASGTVLLARWDNQTAVMEDRVPWFFRSDRSDDSLFVEVTKDADTGSIHTFTVTVEAEQFA